MSEDDSSITESKIYTRPILKAPECPVMDSKPQFGTFYGRFKKFAIKGLKRPFGSIYIPKFITNWRVRSSMRFSFCSDEIIGEITFFSSQFFSFMETVYWDRKTNKKYAYRQFQPYGFIHLPKRLGYNITACRTRRRYVRLLSRLSKGTMHADIDFIGSRNRPTCEARLDVNASGPEFSEVCSVVPSSVHKRCSASYNFSAPVSGWLTADYFHNFKLPEQTSVCFFDYRKAYYTFITKRLMVSGMGRVDGKLVSFHIMSDTNVDSSVYNDNILLINGEITPLPPVRITMPYGQKKMWIVQDTEGMVDLEFTPISMHKRNSVVFFAKFNYITVYGTFDGKLLQKDGKEIKLSKYPGFGRSHIVRF